MFLTFLLVTCEKTVAFSGFSGFLHQWNCPPRYNWNIVESTLNTTNLNHPLLTFIILYIPIYITLDTYFVYQFTEFYLKKWIYWPFELKIKTLCIASCVNIDHVNNVITKNMFVRHSRNRNRIYWTNSVMLNVYLF